MSPLLGPPQTGTIESLRTRERTSPYLEGVRALPTLPSILFRFLGLVADPGVSNQQLADFIWRDPALLARAIPAVSASPSTRTLPVSQLRQGIAWLGREYLRNIAYTTPLVHSFEPLRMGFNAVTFWERSVLCAYACDALARQLKLPVPEQYYVAGLLHDIGYLFFLQKQPAALREVIARWSAQPGDLLQIESEVLGTDHCRLGLEVAAQLDFEPWLRAAIGHHHCPSQDWDWITRITCIGSAFCNSKGIDFYPSRTVARGTREREMEEIIRVLVPDLPEEGPSQLLAAMERTLAPVRRWVLDLLVEFQSAGTKDVPAGAPGGQAEAASRLRVSPASSEPRTAKIVSLRRHDGS